MRKLAAWAAIFNPSREVLLVRLSYDQGQWAIPDALPRPITSGTLLRIADADSAGPVLVKTLDRLEYLR